MTRNNQQELVSLWVSMYHGEPKSVTPAIIWSVCYGWNPKDIWQILCPTGTSSKDVERWEHDPNYGKIPSMAPFKVKDGTSEEKTSVVLLAWESRWSSQGDGAKPSCKGSLKSICMKSRHARSIDKEKCRGGQDKPSLTELSLTQ